MRPGSRAWIGGRLLVAGFCWLTSLYALITSSAFAYQQFIRPRVFHWLGTFSGWHAAVAWVVLALAIVTLWPDVFARPASRALAAIFVAGTAAALVANSLRPVLPTLVNGDRASVIGIGALLPVAWLALVDHVGTFGYLRRQATPSNEEGQRGFEGRLFIAALATAICVTALYTVMTSISVASAFEPDLMTRGLMVGVWRSLVDHLVLFLGASLAVAAIARPTRGHFVAQYVAFVGALLVLFAVVFLRLIANAVGLSGPLAFAAAGMTAVSIVLTWGGMRLRRLDARGMTVTSAADVFFGANPTPVGTRTAQLWSVAALVPLAFLLAFAASRMDWDFVVLKCGVFALWLTAFAAVYRLTPTRPQLQGSTIVMMCLTPLALFLALRIGPNERHILDRYAVHNPSFRVADGALGDAPESRLFDQYLLANTGFTGVSLAPISIDFVRPLPPAPREEKPLIILLVIDSLRADYVSPYNPAVRFTPRIAEFAAENITFRHAFTRYGGTGISMPAIWAGSVVAHKQYVEPFAPMNALDKLLNANRYKKLLSLDHITAELLGPQEIATIDELDRGREEMQFDFCDTLQEMAAKLAPNAAQPTFASTRSLNLHVALVRNGKVPAGESYPGFNDSYAWRVRRMDACFGSFIDALKRRGLYDRSLIILTADHGELLGEDGRWGHSYYMTPEIVQIPLFVHLPAGAPHDVVDPDALALSTDITPTLYAELGYQPTPMNDLMGRSLVRPPGVDPSTAFGASEDRRRGTFVLAASYGAVYAVVRRNGRRLYIADAINSTEHAYERGSDGRWSERQVTEGLRMMNQLAIRHQIDELADLYHAE